MRTSEEVMAKTVVRRDVDIAVAPFVVFVAGEGDEAAEPDGVAPLTAASWVVITGLMSATKVALLVAALKYQALSNASGTLRMSQPLLFIRG